MAHDYRDQAHDAALAFMAKRGLVGYPNLFIKSSDRLDLMIVTWSAQALGDHFLPLLHAAEQRGAERGAREMRERAARKVESSRSLNERFGRACAVMIRALPVDAEEGRNA